MNKMTLDILAVLCGIVVAQSGDGHILGQNAQEVLQPTPCPKDRNAFNLPAPLF